MSNGLILAAKDRNLGQIKLCLASGDNINFQDSQGCTALLWAASFGFIEIVEYLLQKQARYQDRNRNNETPFLSAVIYGKLNVIEYFIHHRLVSTAELEEALFSAVKCGNLEVTQYLFPFFQHAPTRIEDGKTSFLTAIQQGYLDIVKVFYHTFGQTLLQQCDDQGNTALHIAAMHSRLPIIEFLCAQNLEFVMSQRNHAHLDAFSLAIQQKQEKSAKLLLHKGCYIDLSAFSQSIPDHNKKCRRLYNASFRLFKALDPKRRGEFFQLMDFLGDSINGRHFSTGNTALHQSILQGQAWLAHTLLHQGANLFLKNKAQQTAYELAVNHDNPLIRATAHFFNTLHLHRLQQDQGQKPEPRPETKLLSERKTAAESQMPVVSSPRHSKEKSAFETELELTLSYLIRFQEQNTEELRLIPYMYIALGDCLEEKDPTYAAKLFHAVQPAKYDGYFSASRHRLYYLIKHNKIKLDTPKDQNEHSYKIFILIKEMLYAKMTTDDKNTTLLEYIQTYTLEPLENLHKLSALNEVVTQDSIPAKLDFLQLLGLLREKNLYQQTLLNEIERLKKIVQEFRKPGEGDASSKLSSAGLVSIPEMMSLALEGYVEPNSPARSRAPSRPHTPLGHTLSRPHTPLGHTTLAAPLSHASPGVSSGHAPLAAPLCHTLSRPHTPLGHTTLAAPLSHASPGVSSGHAPLAAPLGHPPTYTPSGLHVRSRSLTPSRSNTPTRSTPFTPSRIASPPPVLVMGYPEPLISGIPPRHQRVTQVIGMGDPHTKSAIPGGKNAGAQSNSQPDLLAPAVLKPITQHSYSATHLSHRSLTSPQHTRQPTGGLMQDSLRHSGTHGSLTSSPSGSQEDLPDSSEVARLLTSQQAHR